MLTITYSTFLLFPVQNTQSQFENRHTYFVKVLFHKMLTNKLCKLRNIMRDGQASSDSGFGRSFAFGLEF